MKFYLYATEPGKEEIYIGEYSETHHAVEEASHYPAKHFQVRKLGNKQILLGRKRLNRSKNYEPYITWRMTPSMRSGGPKREK